MANRYRVEGPWERAETITLHDGYAGETYELGTVETATLVDERGGYRYDRGAYRVRSKLPAVRTKTFKGETAWTDAASYAIDLTRAAKRELLAKGELTLR